MRVRAVRRSALIGVSLLLAICAFSASCDTANRIKSKVVAVNLMVDIGDPFDIAPRRTEVAANFMSITGPVDEPTAVPLTGADATLEIEDVAGLIQLNETAADSGVYQASSGTGNPTFVYTSGAAYTIEVVVPSGKFDGTYRTTVVAPPRTNVSGLPDTLGGATIPSNAPLTVTLVGNYDRGFVLVVNSAGTVTFDSRPQDVQAAVNFVFDDFNGQIQIPGTAFPVSGTAYGVVIAGMNSAPSSGISTNLNILTRFYAGAAKTAIVRTAP